VHAAKKQNTIAGCIATKMSKDKRMLVFCCPVILPGYRSRFYVCPSIKGALLLQRAYEFFKITRRRIVRKNMRRQKYKKQQARKKTTTPNNFFTIQHIISVLFLINGKAMNKCSYPFINIYYTATVFLRLILYPESQTDILIHQFNSFSY